MPEEERGKFEDSFFTSKMFLPTIPSECLISHFQVSFPLHFQNIDCLALAGDRGKSIRCAKGLQQGSRKKC